MPAAAPVDGSVCATPLLSGRGAGGAATGGGGRFLGEPR